MMYSNAPGARFDHAYYRDKHMPLVKRRMGDSCRYSIRSTRAWAEERWNRVWGSTAPRRNHIFWESVVAFQNGFGPHTAERLQDLSNFTDIAPVIRISEVLVE